MQRERDSGGNAGFGGVCGGADAPGARAAQQSDGESASGRAAHAGAQGGLNVERIRPRQFGRWAREAGRGINSCPGYGITDEAAGQRTEWRAGWSERDREIGR